MCILTPGPAPAPPSPSTDSIPPRAAYVGCGTSSAALLMDDPLHSDLIEVHEKVAAMFGKDLPRAIVVVSPQWQTQEVVVTASAAPRLQHDYSEFDTEYGGMPSLLGSPDVAAQIIKLLRGGDVKCSADKQAPLVDAVVGSTLLMFPMADVPVVSMSVLSSLSTEEHVHIGTLLQPLCKEGVLFLGLGHSSSLGLSSNIELLPIAGDPLIRSAVKSFKDKLDLTVAGRKGNDVGEALVSWESFPCARLNHPTEEQLMPLLVVAAAVGDAKASKIDASFLGLPLSNYVFR